MREFCKHFGLIAAVGLAVSLGQLVTAFPSKGAVPESDQIINEIRMMEPGHSIQIGRSFHVDWDGKTILKVPSYSLRGWSNPDGSPIENLPDVSISPVAQKPGLYRVEVTLRDVTEPGLYTGKIMLVADGSGGAFETKTFTIRFVASFKPTVSVVPARDLTLKASNCTPTIGHCWFTYLFAPESQNYEYALNVKNDSPSPIDIRFEYWPTGIVTYEPVLLFKEVAGQSEPKASLRISRMMPGESKQIIATVPSPDSLRAATYHGTIQISAVPTGPEAMAPIVATDKSNEGSYSIKNLTTVEVSTTVAVRVGVIWPFVVVILGILAGRVAATLATQGFQTKLNFYPRFMDLQADISRLPDRFKQVLDDLLNDAWRMVLRGIDAATVEPLFDNLERHYTYIGQLKELYDALTDLPIGDVRDHALTETRNALNQLATRNPDMKNVQDIRESVLKALESLKTVANAQPGLEFMAPRGIGWRSKDLVAAKQSRTGIAEFLNTLAGTGTQGIGLYYEWLRPTMHLIILTLLAVQGVWQQYAVGGEAASFGSQGIGQYAILFLWGVSSDFINKTLQTISFGPKGS